MNAQVSEEADESTGPEPVPWLRDLPDAPLTDPGDPEGRVPASRSPSRARPALAPTGPIRRSRPAQAAAQPTNEPKSGAAATALGEAAADVLASVDAAAREALDAIERLATGRAAALEQASASYVDDLSKRGEWLRRELVHTGERRLTDTKEVVDRLTDEVEDRGATEIGGLKRAGLEAKQEIERATRNAIDHIEQIADSVSQRLNRKVARDTLVRRLMFAGLVVVGVLAGVAIVLAVNAS